jgi:phosphatidylinositol glycan class O
VTSLQRTPAYDETNPRTLEATHQKAIIVIIDALRSDFIHEIPSASPIYNEFYHNQLTLPSELLTKYPQHSMLLELYSDPPTTTMQRLKALTTGSLPTFIDAGSNFASTEILEDSLISQWKTAGKRVGVLGDDTWLGLYPLTAELPGKNVPEMGEKYWKRELVHGFDSFNVEDLHSVDEGVINNFFPILANENATTANEWDILILHFLGVDHVGHRVGPSSPLMVSKLRQMDDFLRKTVDELDEDTLLVLLGDHGMDEKGDHGGDGDKETGAAGWLYSKGKRLLPEAITSAQDDTERSYGHLLNDKRYPTTRKSNQIDLVSTLSLMLGTPIPYNNLGSIIPEFFLKEDTFETLHQAMQLNADQVATYLETYPSSTLNPYRDELTESWDNVISTRMDVEELLSRKPEDGFGDGDLKRDLAEARIRSVQVQREYVKSSLGILRGLWAQFSITSMIMGLTVLGLSLPAIWSLYLGIRNTRENWDVYVREALMIAFKLGGFFGSVIGTGRGVWTRTPGEALSWAWTAGVIGSLVTILVIGLPAMGKATAYFFLRPKLMQIVGPGITILYTLGFGANSFIIWEDRVVNFLLTSILLLPVLKAMSAPTHRLRLRILGFSLASAILVRLISISTVCREEQGGYCYVTFYAGATSPVAPAVVLAMILPLGWYLPKIISLVLKESKSNSGPAPFFLFGLQIVLALSAGYWILEFGEHWSGLNPDRIPLIKILKVWVARAALGLTIGAGGVVWSGMPLCIEIKREEQVEALNGQSKNAEDGPQVTVYGFANAFGSAYLLFVMLGFSLLFLVSLPTGQVVLVLGLLVLFCHLQVVDAMRDSKTMTEAFSQGSSPEQFDIAGTVGGAQLAPKFRETIVLPLLAHVLFFATGHQAGFNTIQWKSAFIGVYSVVYPVSPLLLVLNTYSGFILLGLAVPLLALWNVSPIPQGRNPVIADTLQSILGTLLPFTSVAFAGAFFSAWLRRHLMVWKVFAPRFMLAGTTLLIVEATIILAVVVGLKGVTSKVARTFKTDSV